MSECALHEQFRTAIDSYGNTQHIAHSIVPDLKLSDQGLFSGNVFQFIPLWLSDTGL